MNCDVKIGKKSSLVLQVSLQLVGCAVNTEAVPLTRTLAWGWHSPSPMNPDTSKCYLLSPDLMTTKSKHIVFRIKDWMCLIAVKINDSDNKK